MRLPTQLTLPTLNGFTYSSEDFATPRKDLQYIFNQKSVPDCHN